MLQRISDYTSRFQLFALGVCAFVVSALAAPSAFAQTAPTIDTSGVESFLTDEVVTGIAAIGGIMLLVAVVFAGYRWVRGAAGGN